MKRAWCTALVIAAAGGMTTELSGGDRPDATATLERCRVTLIEDVEVPAQEAGQLVAVEVREGMLVEADALLAQIDDRQPRHARTIAELERDAARDEAENDVRVRYAKAAAAVAKAEYQQVVDANRRFENALPAAEQRRKQLAWDSAVLQIEQAEFERDLAGKKTTTRQAEVDAAETAIERRKVRAPLAGLVVDVLRNRGEWVQPGEPVVRLVRIDRLRVEGFLPAAQYRPGQVANRPVSVHVSLPGGGEEFEGKIVFVSPLVESDQFLVRAEVANRTQDDQWLLRPGLTARMSIDLAAPAPPAEAAPPNTAAR
jgi:multidrug efflux pump subunit AcrA (membrane-fusion protein)